MHYLAGLFTRAVDCLIARLGMYLAYRPEWKASRLDAWHDSNGSLTVQAWRFELMCDKGLPQLLRRFVAG